MTFLGISPRRPSEEKAIRNAFARLCKDFAARNFGYHTIHLSRASGGAWQRKGFKLVGATENISVEGVEDVLTRSSISDIISDVHIMI